MKSYKETLEFRMGYLIQPHVPDEKDDETLEEWNGRLTDTIQKMMFVSGETAEASAETTSIIEEIVRQQVIEMVSVQCDERHLALPTLGTDLIKLTQCTSQAARRGSRSISTDDLIFLIRHDKAKVSRLRTFLSWKDVRKNVKGSDDKTGGDAADFAAGEDTAAADVLGGAGAPVVDTGKKNKKAKIGLPWEVASFYNETVPEREDEEDEEEEEMNYATLQRLKKADERTKNMTKEEYVNFSECRQASFTFRKGKRFKEWAGFGVVTDSKPNDDIVDILGFLTFEIVQTLTEEALKVKESEDLFKKNHGEGSTAQSTKRKAERGLFDPPEEGREPVQPRHVQEAFRKLQQRGNKCRAMKGFSRGLHRTPLKLVCLVFSSSVFFMPDRTGSLTSMYPDLTFLSLNINLALLYSVLIAHRRRFIQWWLFRFKGYSSGKGGLGS